MLSYTKTSQVVRFPDGYTTLYVMSYIPRYTGFIDGYKVVYLYILICTEYSPISFSFPYEKSKLQIG
jgi:hypothetical protein